MDQSILDLTPPAGCTPVVGSLLAQLRLSKYVIHLKLDRLTVRQLDFRTDQLRNSIGMLLKHMVLVEKMYQTYVFLGRQLDEQESALWHGSFPENFIFEKCNNKPIEYYFSLWDEVRAVTESHLREKRDEWLSDHPRGYLRRYGNHLYCLFHIMEDQLCHYGQIKNLISIQRTQDKPAEYDQR